MTLDLEIIAICKIKDANNVKFKITTRPEKHFHDNKYIIIMFDNIFQIYCLKKHLYF